MKAISCDYKHANFIFYKKPLYLYSTHNRLLVLTMILSSVNRTYKGLNDTQNSLAQAVISVKGVIDHNN